MHGLVGPHDGAVADAQVEDAPLLVLGHALSVEPGEHRRPHPARGIDDGAETGRERAREVAGYTAARDVSEGQYLAPRAQRAHVVEVAMCGREQEVRVVLVVPAEQRPHEREPVRVEARGGETEHRVPRPDARAVDQPVALDQPDARACEVDLRLTVDARHLGALTTQDRAPGSPADIRGALHELHDLAQVEAVRGCVVEEEQRLRPRRQHVVDAVGRQIGAAVAQAAGLPGEHELRTHAVGGGGKQPPLVEREEAGEASDVPHNPRRPRRLEGASKPLHDLLGLPKRDSGTLVRVLHASPILSAHLDAPYNAAACEVRRAADPFDLLSMLTVQDIVSLPALRLRVAAGAAGLPNDVRWLHASELADPTPWLEGGELLLSTGLGIGSDATEQSAYIGRLAGHRLAGLGFGLGFGHETVPTPLVEEADRQSFPIFEVPYEVPFIAISKAVFSHLASEQLELVTQALEVHERLAQAVTHGRGAESLLAVVASHLGCSLALVDESGRVLVERHARRRVGFENALELPVVADDELAVLRAARAAGEFGEYDRLVLHHAQTALAFELSRRHAVSAAELRLAGDLLDDLEHERLDDREAGRRMAAFGLEPGRQHATLVGIPRDGRAGGQVRAAVARELDRRAIRYLSTVRRDRAAFLVEIADEEAALTLARELIELEPGTRVGVGRPAQGRALGRSLLEARAALGAASASVVSYRDLGSLELLLSLPDAALEAFVDRVLGPAAPNAWLTESLAALLESGCRWSEAAERLGVHRHTLRYRMERLREQTGRHPDDPEQRMELWLAVKATQALASRREPEPVG